jgi:hypothetical protein
MLYQKNIPAQSLLREGETLFRALAGDEPLSSQGCIPRSFFDSYIKKNALEHFSKYCSQQKNIFRKR